MYLLWKSLSDKEVVALLNAIAARIRELQEMMPRWGSYFKRQTSDEIYTLEVLEQKIRDSIIP